MYTLNNRNKIILAIGIAAILSFNFISSGDSYIALDQPGIKWHRSAVILEGQDEGALKFGKDVTEYVNENYPGLNVQVYLESAGGVGGGGTMHWFVDYENQEKLDEFNQKLNLDEGFGGLIVSAEGVFDVPVDRILNSIY